MCSGAEMLASVLSIQALKYQIVAFSCPSGAADARLRDRFGGGSEALAVEDMMRMNATRSHNIQYCLCRAWHGVQGVGPESAPTVPSLVLD